MFKVWWLSGSNMQKKIKDKKHDKIARNKKIMQMQAKKGCKKRQSEVENYGNVRIFANK